MNADISLFECGWRVEGVRCGKKVFKKVEKRGEKKLRKLVIYMYMYMLKCFKIAWNYGWKEKVLQLVQEIMVLFLLHKTFMGAGGS